MPNPDYYLRRNEPQNDDSWKQQLGQALVAGLTELLPVPASSKTVEFTVSFINEALVVQNVKNIGVELEYINETHVKVNGVPEAISSLTDAAFAGAVTLGILGAASLIIGTPIVASSVLGIGIGVAVNFAYSRIVGETSAAFFDSLAGTADVDVRLFAPGADPLAGALYRDGLQGLSEFDAVKDLLQAAISSGEVTFSEGYRMQAFTNDSLGNPVPGDIYFIRDTSFSTIDNFFDRSGADSFGAQFTFNNINNRNDDYLVEVNDQEWMVYRNTDEIRFLPNLVGQNPITFGAEYVVVSDDFDFAPEAIGSPEDDLIIDASADGNVIYAFGGDDYVYGGAGNDVILGFHGDDYLYGDGGATSDSVSGDDILKGGLDDDHLFGGHGNDHLFGGSGEDVILGGTNDEYSVLTLARASRGLEVSGIAGDTLEYEGLNSDAYIEVNLRSDVYALNQGINRIILGNTAKAFGGYDDGSASSVTDTDYVSGIENVLDTVNSDILIGTDDTNIFRYSGGNDFFYGEGDTDAFIIEAAPKMGEAAYFFGGDDSFRDFGSVRDSASNYNILTPDFTIDSLYLEHKETGGLLRFQDTQVVFDQGSVFQDFRRGGILDSTGDVNRFVLNTGLRDDGSGSGGVNGGSSYPDFDREVETDADDNTIVKITPIDPDTGNIIPDFETITCVFPRGDSGTIYVDGIPIIYVTGDGGVIDYPDFGNVIGLKPDDVSIHDASGILFNNANGTVIGDLDIWGQGDVSYSTSYESTYIEGTYAAMSLAAASASPLVLDLDGDGIEVISLANSSIFWDLDEDGFAENSGWTSADDGLLAIDLDGDGYITDHTELFGSVTEDGFSALSVYDTNSDNIIDANDAQFSDLLVWQDVNQNAIGGEGELFSLAELNITSIDLNAALPADLVLEGHQVSHTSSFVIDDGVNPAETRDIYDVWFQYDNANTLYNGDIDLVSATIELPNLRGYGNVPTLQIGMSLDQDESDSESLLSQVIALNDLEFSELFSSSNNIADDVESILFRWAGVDDIFSSLFRGAMNAQELGFLESFKGEQFLQRGYNPNPLSDAALELQNAFKTAFNNMYARFLAQTDAADIFTGTPLYNMQVDVVEGITGLDHTQINILEAEALLASDALTFWQSVVRLVEFSVGTANLVQADITYLNDAIVASDATLDLNAVRDTLGFEQSVGLTLTADNSGETLTGTLDDDTLEGGTGNDELIGLEGNDELIGNDGEDILNGGGGSDYLIGGDGNDTYVFEAGEAIDTIQEKNGLIGSDTIKFGAGIALADLTFIRGSNTDLLIEISEIAGGGQIVVENQFNNDLVATADGAIEFIEFDDASTFDLSTVDYTLQGIENSSQLEILHGVTSGGGENDTIFGNGGRDIINGYDGDDILDGGNDNDDLRGHEGNDTLIGGAGDDKLDSIGGNNIFDAGEGNDIILGGVGDDTYIYTSGFDQVIAEYGGNDVVVLPEGITEGDITINKIGNALSLEIGDLGSFFAINHFIASLNVIETIRFHDGSEINLIDSDVEQVGTEGFDFIVGGTIGYSLNDVMYGLGGADNLNGGAGNDRLIGGEGNDTIIGGIGSDTSVYTGDYEDYTVVPQSFFGLMTVTDNVGNEGMDTIWFSTQNAGFPDVEKLEFADGVYDTASNIFTSTASNDDFFDATSAAEHHDGGTEGIDTVSYAESSGRVTVDLQNNTGTHNDAAGDTYTSIERVIGTNNGADSLYGDAEDNILLGLDGSDNLEGGAGADILDGGDNTDYVRYTRSDAGVDVDLERAVQEDGHAEGDVLINIEHFYGTNFDDVFRGENTYNNVLARGGNDIIEGRGGSDRLYGGSGDDAFIYESGKQQFFEEGAGIDRVEFNAVWAPEDAYVNGDVIIFEEGLNQITFNDITLFEAFAFEGHSDLTLQQLVTLSGGAPVIDNTPSVDDDVLIGTAAAELLDGGAGTDTTSYAASSGRVTVDLENNSGTHNLAAGDTYASVENVIGTQNGSDYLYGDANTNHLQALDGNDYLEGGAGADILDGGDGTDYARYIRSDDAVSVDLIQTVQSGGHAEGDQLVNIEHLYGTAYDDTFRGNESYNKIYGRNGDDNLDGRGGSDYLYGGNGDDLLAGGAGVDLLYGQAGADTFIFKAIYEYSNNDLVQDFRVAEGDKIDISSMLQGYDALTDAITDFVQITDNGTNSYVFVDDDGGADNFIKIATLYGEIGLTDEDALEASGTLVTTV